MKQFSRQLHNEAKTVKLRAVERAELKERLQMYMEYHPLPTPSNPKNERSNIASEPFWVLPFNNIYTKVAAGVFSLLVLVGVPVAAEQAVPGDILYQVKIQVNEEVRSSLAFSTHEKIAWETKRLERRIEEVRTLASQGRLTDDIDMAVAAAVHEHSQAAQKEIAALRSVSAEEAALAELTFASSLAVQSEMFARTVTATDLGNPSQVLAAVQIEEKEANERSSQNEQPSYASLLARLEEETTMASELFASIRQAASAEQVEKIERRFADVQTKITLAQNIENSPAMDTDMLAVREVQATATAVAAAPALSSATTSDEGTSTIATVTTGRPVSESEEVSITELETEKDQDSRTLLREALKDVQKLITFMSDITIQETVKLDDWIPVTLSNEERVNNLQSLILNIKNIQTLIEDRDEAIELPEKVQAHKQQLLENVLQIETLIQQDDITAAETLVEDTHALAVDLEQLLESTTNEAANRDQGLTDGQSGAATAAATTSSSTSNVE